MSPLVDQPPGNAATLRQVDGEGAFRRRLLELGLLPGTELRLLRRSDVHDLVEVEARGCHLTLRRAEARCLLVEPRLG